jgi:hypothetical protein
MLDISEAWGLDITSALQPNGDTRRRGGGRSWAHRPLGGYVECAWLARSSTSVTIRS